MESSKTSSTTKSSPNNTADQPTRTKRSCWTTGCIVTVGVAMCLLLLLVVGWMGWKFRSDVFLTLPSTTFHTLCATSTILLFHRFISIAPLRILEMDEQLFSRTIRTTKTLPSTPFRNSKSGSYCVLIHFFCVKFSRASSPPPILLSFPLQK